MLTRRLLSRVLPECAVYAAFGLWCVAHNSINRFEIAENHGVPLMVAWIAALLARPTEAKRAESAARARARSMALSGTTPKRAESPSVARRPGQESDSDSDDDRDLVSVTARDGMLQLLTGIVDGRRQVNEILQQTSQDEATSNLLLESLMGCLWLCMFEKRIPPLFVNEVSSASTLPFDTRPSLTPCVLPSPCRMESMCCWTLFECHGRHSTRLIGEVPLYPISTDR